MNLKNYITKGKVSLFVICFLFSLFFGAVGYLFSDRLTAISLSAIFGTLSLQGINTFADLIGFGMPVGKSSGVFGICVGTLIIILI